MSILTIPELEAHTATAAPIVDRLRDTFDSGRTRPLSWRRRQLDGLVHLLADNEGELLHALATDLGRPRFKGWLVDLRTSAREIRHARSHLRRWARDEHVRPPWPLLATHPRIGARTPRSRARPRPWNYPVQMVMVPLAAALAAGNTAVLKPSELSPTVSATLTRLLPEYVDRDAIAVVDGGAAETQALLAVRFDHIFYTGNGRVGRLVANPRTPHPATSSAPDQ